MAEPDLMRLCWICERGWTEVMCAEWLCVIQPGPDVFTQSAARIKQADLNADTAVRPTLGKYQTESNIARCIMQTCSTRYFVTSKPSSAWDASEVFHHDNFVQAHGDYHSLSRTLKLRDLLTWLCQNCKVCKFLFAVLEYKSLCFLWKDVLQKRTAHFLRFVHSIIRN